MILQTISHQGYIRYVFITCLVLCTQCIFSQTTTSSFFSNANRFYQSYVSNGLVDYGAISLSDRSNIRTQIASYNLDFIGIEEQKAFLINAYNLLTIISISEHYPVSSVKKISNFFKTKHRVGGLDYSLDEIETKLMEDYSDYRVHLALVCGALSCPPLPNYAYVPTNLDKQLDHITTQVVNDVKYVRFTDTQLEISTLFKWHFDNTQNISSVIDFINKNRYEAVAQNTTIEYKGYDWRINDLKSVKPEEEASRYYYSRLYDKGQWEGHIFNNYYSHKESQSNAANFDSRSNFYTILGQFLYGVNDRLNLGFELKFRSANQNFREASSAWEALSFRNKGLAKDAFGDSQYSRIGLTAFGPRIKYQPIADIPNISIQHTLHIPLGSNLEGDTLNGFLDWSHPTMINQLFFDQDLGSSFSLFLEAGLVVENIGPSFFKQGSGLHQISNPINIITSYFPDNKTTFYLLINATPRWRIQVNDLLQSVRESDAYSQYGIGYKYFVTNDLQLEFLYTIFNGSQNNRSARTFNLGVKYFGR